MQNWFLLSKHRIIIDILDGQITVFKVCSVYLLLGSCYCSMLKFLTSTDWLAYLRPLRIKRDSWNRFVFFWIEWGSRWLRPERIDENILFIVCWFVDNRMHWLFAHVDNFWNLFILWPFSFFVDCFCDLRIYLLLRTISFISSTLERMLDHFLFVQMCYCSRICISSDLICVRGLVYRRKLRIIGVAL